MLPLPPQTLLLVGGALLLGRSTACSLDWGASGSLSLPERGESLRFLGQLKSVPAHRCLRDRTHFRCPWKKGAGAREEWQEATCCYPEVLRQVLHLFGSEDSREAWPEKALEQLLTNVLSDLQDTPCKSPEKRRGSLQGSPLR
ncbi:interferon alpha-C-like [Meriones unguiculatus]|uniref:interferon alpha-C-like n=1 Tax=Meriones unguiculatus TaxID=10047 RepID=UPI00293F62BD|nr:interferon alpha-C-like [Meriones unguiculatus]